MAERAGCLLTILPAPPRALQSPTGPGVIPFADGQARGREPELATPGNLRPKPGPDVPRFRGGRLGQGGLQGPSLSRCPDWNHPGRCSPRQSWPLSGAAVPVSS